MSFLCAYLLNALSLPLSYLLVCFFCVHTDRKKNSNGDEEFDIGLLDDDAAGQERKKTSGAAVGNKRKATDRQGQGKQNGPMSKRQRKVPYLE